MTNLQKFKDLLGSIKGETDIKTIDNELLFYFNGLSFNNVVKLVFAEPIADAELKTLFKPTLDVYKILYPNLKSLNVILSRIRNIIKSNQSHDMHDMSNSKLFSLSKTTTDTIKREYDEHINEVNMNKIAINTDSVLSLFKRLMNDHSNIDDLAILLMIAGGFRMSELFRNTVQADRIPLHIKIGNIAKKRGDKKDTTTKRPIIRIPVSTFIMLLNKYRTHYRNDTTIQPNGILNTGIAHTINKRVKRYFQGQSSSILRKIYATLAYTIFNDTSKTNFNVYIKSRFLEFKKF